MRASPLKAFPVDTRNTGERFGSCRGAEVLSDGAAVGILVKSIGVHEGRRLLLGRIRSGSERSDAGEVDCGGSDRNHPLEKTFPKDFPRSFRSLNKAQSKSAVTNLAHSRYKKGSRPSGRFVIPGLTSSNGEYCREAISLPEPTSSAQSRAGLSPVR
jgi:hypothetical protein